MPYHVTVDQTGHNEGFAVCDPTGRQMAYLQYTDDADEQQAEDDALLIAEALNAYTGKTQSAS